MKKTLLLILIFILSFSTLVYAEIDNEHEHEVTEEAVEKIVYDNTKAKFKVFVPSLITAGPSPRVSTPFRWEANSEWYGGAHMGIGSSDSLEDVGSGRYPIDRIYAKTRVYFGNGLTGSQTDDNTNSSKAGCTVFCSLDRLHIGDHEVYTSHKFEESGYTSWYPETFDDW